MAFNPVPCVFDPIYLTIFRERERERGSSFQPPSQKQRRLSRTADTDPVCSLSGGKRCEEPAKARGHPTCMH